MTPREWLDGRPWDGNGGAFAELACWRVSLLLWSVVVASALACVAFCVRSQPAPHSSDGVS